MRTYTHFTQIGPWRATLLASAVADGNFPAIGILLHSAWRIAPIYLPFDTRPRDVVPVNGTLWSTGESPSMARTVIRQIARSSGSFTNARASFAELSRQTDIPEFDSAASMRSACRSRASSKFSTLPIRQLGYQLRAIIGTSGSDVKVSIRSRRRSGWTRSPSRRLSRAASTSSCTSSWNIRRGWSSC